MNMEQLTEDAVAARKEGLTYGQYIAKNRPPLPMPERFPKKKAKETQEQQPEKPQAVLCAICGAEIPNATRNRKYCGSECADIAITRQKAESARRRKEAREAEQRRGEG